jgi:hypothetical protein
MRERLIVPSTYTRKFLLYHPSDLVMLGSTEDMRRYWSAPLDSRSGSLTDSDWMDTPLAQVNVDGNPAESYLGVSLCRSLGRTVAGTVRDSWDFYRDLFAVVDNSWFDLLWLKNPQTPDVATRTGLRTLVTQAFWERLRVGDETVAGDLHGTNPQAQTLRALTLEAA